MTMDIEKMMRYLITVFTVLAVVGQAQGKDDRGLAVTQGGAGKRVALVIGNNSYQHVDPLEKAVNDAQAVGKALEQAQFATRVIVNASRAQMNTAINRFVADVSGGGIGVLFFAGHGVQVNNQNFLIPVDLQDAQSEADIADQGVSLQGVQDKLAEARAKFSLLVIDACRNNPLPKKAGRALGGTRGMAQASSAEGQMVVFSAGANQQALDKLSNGDANPNGVFTREFLPWLTKPGVTIRDAVLQVRSSVRARAKSVNHEQFPAIYDQAEGNFYFVEGDGTQVASLVPVPVPAQQVAQARSKEQIEDDTWKTAEGINTAEAYETYLTGYPSGRYAVQAKMKLSVLKKQPAAAPKPEPVASAAKPEPAKPAQPAPPTAKPAVAPPPATEPAPAPAFREPEMVAIPGKSYEMGKYEVTVGQYLACVGAGGCREPEWRENGSYHYRTGSDDHYRKLGKALTGENHPIVGVSWNDAQAYASWLSKKTGNQYRLPTEAEWEYACYGGSKTEYCGGDNIDAVAWYESNSGKTPHPVGQKQANGYGLYDMSGNVWEWMENCYDSSCAERALRGGSWDNGPQGVRAADRHDYGVPAVRSSGGGFRLARTLP